MAHENTAYRNNMHMFEFEKQFADKYSYFSDQSSPMSCSSNQSPIPSPTTDGPCHFSSINATTDQCGSSYDGYLNDYCPVYTSLVPVDGSALRLDEAQVDVVESSCPPAHSIQVFQFSSGDFCAFLGGYKYPIDPHETFESNLSYQTQPNTIPVTATEKAFPPVYCSGTRGSARHTGSGRNRKLPRAERLWEFILRLLMDPNYNPSHIEWVDRERGMFRLVNSRHIAKMWGKRKNNHDMTYEKLSRAMRYYYHRKILQPVFGKKLVYKFGPNSTGWQLSDPVQLSVALPQRTDPHPQLKGS